MKKWGSEPNYNTEKCLELKEKFSKYEIDKCKGAIIRSKAKYFLKGEKCTLFFLGLEKSTQRRTYLRQIENVKGEVVDVYVEILETVENFYRDLF